MLVRGSVRVHVMAHKKKPKLPKKRNPMALPAKMKTGGGAHKNKADKRKNENHNPDFTKDDV
jgi:hypothetical protein